MEGLTSNLTNGTMDHGTAAPVEFSYFSLVIVLVVLLPIVSLDLILRSGYHRQREDHCW